jgi:hypothetical protein
MNGRFVQATRLMNGVTARVEKRVLIWMAERMPAWIHSDHLTSLAAIAMVGASVSYAAARSWPPALLLVNVCLAINWFRNQQRPRFGFYVDHVIDCGGIALLLLGMAASGLMSLPLALGVLVAYFLVSLEVYLATYCLATFRMSFLGFGPTELRLLLAVANVIAFYRPTATLFGQAWPVFDVGAIVAIPLLVIAFLIGAVRNGRALFAAEPRPSARSSRCADSPPSSDARRPPARAETPRESLA